MANSLNKITTKSILDATVATEDLANDAVTTVKITDLNVVTDKLANLAVATGKLANDAVTGAKLADDAVGAEHIEQLDSHLQLADNSKVRLGTGDDLNIYFDGTNSHISAAAGVTYIDSQLTWFRDGAGSENYCLMNSNAGVALYYDNAQKFTTSSTGITVTGSVIADNTPGYNLIINGDMNIAQRGTSSTSSGLKCIDRWAMYAEGANATLTQSRSDVAAGTTPYQLGFRRAFKILNAGQSNSNVGGDTLRIEQHIEDQIVARSGRNYKSSSDYLTLSFWVKSSVAQDFAIVLYNRGDLSGTDVKMYSKQFTVSSADTWTKITHSIPGASGLTFDNDNTLGLTLQFFMYMGGDDTASNHTQGQWADYDGANIATDQTITWWTTSNATIEITGVQLETGTVATNFNHRSHSDELARCQRYYEILYMSNGTACCYATGDSTYKWAAMWYFKQEKRAQASVALLDDAVFTVSGGSSITLTGIFTSKDHAMFYYDSGLFRLGDNNQHASVKAESEL